MLWDPIAMEAAGVFFLTVAHTLSSRAFFVVTEGGIAVGASSSRSGLLGFGVAHGFASCP